MSVFYLDVDSLFGTAIHDAFRKGKVTHGRNGKTYELIGWSGTLNTCCNFLRNPRRNLNKAYAYAELLWYLSRDNRTDMIKYYAPQYDNFTEPDGTAHGAYGYRIATLAGNHDQLSLLVEHLQKTRETNSRQAIVAMWDATDLAVATHGAKKDLPCTTHWQFLLRNNSLHMIASMRSNDIWLGLPYDIFVNTSIQRLICNELGVNFGSYTHNVGSLHLYEKNFEAAKEAEHAYIPSNMEHVRCMYDTLINANLAVKVEEQIRTCRFDHERKPNLGPFMNQVISCLWTFHKGKCDACNRRN